MSDKGAGKWLPYNLNGSVHECKKETSTAKGTKKVETITLTLETVDTRLKRLEAILLGDRMKE